MANIHWLALFLLGALFGSSFLFAEILLNTLNAYTIVFIRIGLTGILLLIGLIVYYRGRIIWNGMVFGLTKQQWRDLCIMAVFITIGPFLCVVYGQNFITGGLASILNATTAFQGMILASLFFANERLQWNRFLGVLLGIIGVIIAIGFEEILNPNQSLGGLFVVLGGTCISIGSVWGKFRLQTVPIIVSVMAVNLIGAVEMLPLILTVYADQIALIDRQILIYGLLYALIPTVFAFPLYFYLLKYVGSSGMTLNTIVVVPSAFLLEYIFLDEPFVANQLYGFMVIIMGLLLLDGRVLGIKKL